MTSHILFKEKENIMSLSLFHLFPKEDTEKGMYKINSIFKMDECILCTGNLIAKKICLYSVSIARMQEKIPRFFFEIIIFSNPASVNGKQNGVSILSLIFLTWYTLFQQSLSSQEFEEMRDDKQLNVINKYRGNPQ